LYFNGFSLRVPEKDALKRVYAPKKEGIMKEWRKSHDDDYHEVYCSHNTNKTIKSHHGGYRMHM
jgi:hypothetical protein